MLREVLVYRFKESGKFSDEFVVSGDGDMNYYQVIEEIRALRKSKGDANTWVFGFEDSFGDEYPVLLKD